MNNVYIRKMFHLGLFFRICGQILIHM